MAYSKSINIFLPTGSSDGPIELEMLNWNGMVIKLPRKEVNTYTGAELNKPGIYFLFCNSEETGESVYVGEAENLLLRLKQHINDHKNGKEKFFWQAAVCVSGKDLNKALIRHLENYYCEQVKHSSTYNLLTQKSSPNMTLKRAEIAAMQEFSDNVDMLMGAIGYTILENSAGASGESSDKTYFYCKTKAGANAKGFYSDKGFTVLPGSKVVENCSSKTFKESRYSDLLDKLIKNKIIADWVFEKEYTFSSPSAAAGVVTQGYVSGNEYWIDADGKKLKDYNI
ncbi:GIY-YIG nuclease family protein [Clostridium sp. JN-9]|uniref:GIY-YIG nuclease family protein n=1 Tax=Clostridium sp. JN-9 TaxID=2507159 RepID=UPI000FFDFAAC|nr:GIY-YIG nuclease family protein [Clostridium sp. JN-9]QAT40675.1 GIY-YIG nuclease family protein [Clostridium sp. JN-9]